MEQTLFVLLQEARHQLCSSEVTSHCTDSRPTQPRCSFPPFTKRLVPLCQGEHSCGTRSDDVIPGDDIIPDRSAGYKCPKLVRSASPCESYSAVLTCFHLNIVDGVYKEICSDLSLSKMSESKWWYMHILGRGAVEMKSEVYAFWSLTFVKTSSQLFILKVWSHTNMWVTQSCKSSCKSSLWVTGIDL